VTILKIPSATTQKKRYCGKMLLHAISGRLLIDSACQEWRGGASGIALNL